MEAQKFPWYHLENFHLGAAVMGELHGLLMVVVVEECYVHQKEGVEEEGLPDLTQKVAKVELGEGYEFHWLQGVKEEVGVVHEIQIEEEEEEEVGKVQEPQNEGEEVEVEVVLEPQNEEGVGVVEAEVV